MTESQNAQKEWEVGVRRTDTGEWEHYHPTAETEDEAKEEALDMAKGIGTNTIASVGDPVEVYMCSGPYERGGA